MLISGVYAKLVEVEDNTIDKCITKCWFNFFKKLDESFLKKYQDAGTIRMYNIFNYGKVQSFNIENIIYECTSCDHQLNFNRFYQNMINDSQDCSVKDEDVKDITKYNVKSNDKIGEEYKIDVDVITKNGYNGKLMDYFGKGEFPFLNFKVIKIGKVEYYTYKIVR